ncbi:hypothetical protein PG995_008161 [Apiospora arundinis]
MASALCPGWLRHDPKSVDAGQVDRAGSQEAGASPVAVPFTAFNSARLPKAGVQKLGKGR